MNCRKADINVGLVTWVLNVTFSVPQNWISTLQTLQSIQVPKLQSVQWENHCVPFRRERQDDLLLLSMSKG